jgi:hypothetical protein
MRATANGLGYNSCRREDHEGRGDAVLPDTDLCIDGTLAHPCASNRIISASLVGLAVERREIGGSNINGLLSLIEIVSKSSSSNSTT